MPKRKTKTTADLVVHHTERHLAARTSDSEHAENLIGIGIFSLTGVLVLMLTFQILQLSFSQTAQSGYIASNADSYAAQEAFYTGTALTQTSDPTAAVESVHAAATAASTADTVLFTGLALVAFVLFYLYHQHGWLLLDRPHFTVRKIR